MPTPWTARKAAPSHRKTPGGEGPSGSRSAGTCALGLHGNLGALVVSSEKQPDGEPVTQPPGPGGPWRVVWERTNRHSAGSVARGNECDAMDDEESAHKALDATWKGLMNMDGGWVLDLDIRSFFDEVDRGRLQQMLRQRVNDGVVRRLVGKWLNAGVMEKGRVHHPTSGTPQGGVISPLQASIYLHVVLDVWFEREVRPRLKGRSFMVRYADDAVMCFEREDDARRVFGVLPKRVCRYGLRLHSEKTRLVRFTCPRRDKGDSNDDDLKPGSFDLLGLTHYWGRSRRGNWVVKRCTSKKRFSRALRMIAQWCRVARHLPVKEQHKTLWMKLRGHYAYYGITGNGEALVRFRYFVKRIWHKWLGRRNQRRMSWERFSRLE